MVDCKWAHLYFCQADVEISLQTQHIDHYILNLGFTLRITWEFIKYQGQTLSHKDMDLIVKARNQEPVVLKSSKWF